MPKLPPPSSDENKVMDDIMDNMALASEFNFAVVRKKRGPALTLLRNEGLSDEDAKRCYTHFRERWKGQSMRMEEISAESLVGIERLLENWKKERRNPQPTYVIRLGMEVLMGVLEFRKAGDPVVFNTGYRQIEGKDVAQIWTLVPSSTIKAS